MKVLIVSLLMVGILLAGCADSGPENNDGAVSGGVDGDNTQLAAGKGAIDGLLVDDRFRPIHLTDDPVTEFQASGFVLLQETGQQVKTDENGQFAFLDLEPGRYTLRVTAEGHEVSPAPVTVEADKFAETSVVARRVVNSEGVVVVQEFAVFVPCTVGYVIQSFIYNCATDLSGDNYRGGFQSDYTNFTDATALVTEMKATDPDRYTLQVREIGNGLRFAVDTFDGDYTRMINRLGERNLEHNDQNRNVWWNNSVVLETLMFPGAPFEQEISESTAGLCNQQVDDTLETIDDVVPEEDATLGFAPIPRTCGGHEGIGAGLAYEARITQSLFLGTPEVDLDAYCIICD